MQYLAPPDFQHIQASWLNRLTPTWQDVRPTARTLDTFAALFALERDGKVERHPTRRGFYRLVQPAVRSEKNRGRPPGRRSGKPAR